MHGSLLVVLLIAGCVTGAAGADSWWLNLRTTGYAYQSLAPVGDANDHLEGYQHISGAANGLASGRLGFRLSARFADDLRYDAAAIDASRLHAAQLIYKPTRKIQIEAGRSFIQEGVTSLTLDGVRISYRHDRSWRATAWGGGRAPVTNTFDTADPDRDAARGARIEYAAGPSLRLGVFTAYRKRDGIVAQQPLGFDGTLAMPAGILFRGRAAYDLELEHWRRIEGHFLRRQSGRQPEVGLQLLSRRPSVDAASWFHRFAQAERIQLARLNLRQVMHNGWGGEVEYLGTFVDDRSSTRFGLASLLPFGRIGWSMHQGDTGDDNGFYGDIGGRLNDWLRAEGSASILSYTLLQDDPNEEDRVITTLAGRIRARLKPGLTVTAEIQRMATPVHEHDVRFLLGVNLSAAGGASRFGLNSREVRP